MPYIYVCNIYGRFNVSDLFLGDVQSTRWIIHQQKSGSGLTRRNSDQQLTIF
jgi:hypothetical protein